MSGLQNQTFDDRDTDHLKYQGFWFLTGSYNASSVGQTGTLSSTSDLNANVTFTFPTPAIAFYYFGIPRCCGGQYGICIDCDPNQPNFIQIDGVNVTDDGHNPPVALFSKVFDTPGIHEIIIRNENDPRFGKSQLTLDGIVLEVPSSTGGSSSSSSSSTLKTSTAGSGVTDPSSSATNSAASTPGTSTPIGAIVGGVLGALAFLLAIIVLAFWIRVRRRRAAGVLEGPNNDSQSPAPHTPFVQPFSQPSISSIPSNSTWNTASPVTTATHGSRPLAVGLGDAQFQSASTFSEATSSSRLATSTSTPRRERDAGPAEVDEEVLPPDYGDVFASRRASSARTPRTLGYAPPTAGGSDTGGPAGFSPVRRKS